MSKSGDNYATGDVKDLMNEGSSSRLYSFNIYVYFLMSFITIDIIKNLFQLLHMDYLL